jgi:hypothetical protein
MTPATYSLYLITLSDTNTNSVGLLWTRDRPVAETSTYTTRSTNIHAPGWVRTHKSQQASGRKTTPSDRAATVINKLKIDCTKDKGHPRTGHEGTEGE